MNLDIDVNHIQALEFRLTLDSPDEFLIEMVLQVKNTDLINSLVGVFRKILPGVVFSAIAEFEGKFSRGDGRPDGEYQSQLQYSIKNAVNTACSFLGFEIIHIEFCKWSIVGDWWSVYIGSAI